LAREDRPGDKRLVAYLTGEGTATAELRRHLAASLPEYMIPAAFVVLPALPLSPNGKVDRKLLPAPEARAEGTREPVAPRTPLEAYLAGLWQERLGVERVGIEDDFFALGGNSISGAILINQIQEKLGEIVHVVVIFDAPTVERMAAYLLENHARTVQRIWGLAAGGDRREDRIDAAKAAQMRALIHPLPPLAAGESKNPPAVFVLAPPRSGTTLLRVLLGGHPRLFAPPELELLTHDTMAERRAAYTGREAFWLEGLVRAVMEIRGCGPDEAAAVTEGWERDGWPVQRAYRQLQEWLGDRILVDKTPSYAFNPGVLRRAEAGFDGALYVHLVRHPGGMIRSFDEAKLDRIFFRRPHPFTRRELAELLWLISQENILRFLEDIPEERRHAVRFEDLLRDPEPVLRGLCNFLGLDFEPAMLRPYDGRRMTDGLRAESRMLGDVKFHTHSGIDAGVAERWREELPEESLGDETVRMAAALGYEARAGRASSSIPRRAWRPGEPRPLSFSQERLWFLGQFDPDSSFYNITNVLRFAGPLDIAALARSLDAIRRRHEVLRTVFSASAAGPFQVVVDPPAVGMPVVDLSGLPDGARERETSRVARAEGWRPFDLAADPMLRTLLLRLGETDHALVVAMHHVASDGWSMGVFLSELSDLYSARALPELPIQYADFAVWQRGRLSGEALDREIAWWREALAGAPALIQLPTDRPRPAVQRFRGGQVQGFLPDGLVAEVVGLGRQQGATPFMAFAAAFAALLSRISGQAEVLLGTPIAGRNWPEVQGLIGFFLNTLVVRGNMAGVAGDPDFRELLARSRQSSLGAFAHQEVPFEKLVEELQPERSLTHSPIFQVMFALQNLPPRRFELPGLEITAYKTGGGTSKFDLNLLLAETGGRLLGTLEYNSDLFDHATALRLFGSFETLLRGLAADPGRRLSDLSLIGEAERHQMLREWNDTAAPFPPASSDGCLHQPFEARAAVAPEAVAAVFEGRSLTYGELDRKANRLANRLRSLGVGPGRFVAVHLERSLETLAAVLAVHKAGGAYVPIEVSWPLDRLRYILESERIAHLITSASRLEALAEVPPVAHVIRVEDGGDDPSAPAASAGPEDPAYVIFTSGSTGRPKGVVVRHRPAVNLVNWVNRRFRVGPGDTLLFVTALSFDLSVYDVFGILAAGGTVRVASEAELRDPEALVRILLGEPVTFWDSAPAALQQLVRWLPAGPQPAALRLVFNSGDWIPVTLPDRVRQTFPGAEFVSLGGATEATVWSNVFPVAEVAPHWTSIPYGRPIDNARYHVLDGGLNPCPVGVAGDLHIGGLCLSDGYAGSPALTAEKYLPDPFGGEAGGRLYRTGDRARYLPDGNLEFLGRLDNQVKIRGYRIELGEIESVLCAHPAVREAVVLAREDTPGDQRLVAYFIPEGEAPAAPELRRFVRDRLPEYMAPSAFVALESWPLAATGKLDRKALPPPEGAKARTEAPALPRAGLETAIAEIWKEVVGLAEVGVRDNFFDVGGHSLLMARVHVRLEEALGLRVSMVDLFQYPTIAALAAHLGPAAETKALATAVLPATASEEVAVIGLAGRFPGAPDVEAFWRNLRDGVESIRTFTDEELRASGYGDEILDPRFVKARGALDGPDLFDAAFFDYPPREAQIIDPQQRHFLECAWEALENAGYGAAAGRRRVGVFAGTSGNTYVLNLLLDPDVLRSVGRMQIQISNSPDYLPTRVSYKLNLRGPSLNVQTACSTSLVAVHLARLSLLRGECEIALAGGVSVKPLEVGGYLYSEGGINSPDGHTRAFDERAQGVVGGSGAGAVVLKRLADALADGDTIHAVIRGSAVNNDGSGKPGFTAPSVEGQAEAIREAHRSAGVEPGSITFVEAHGTGTPMGDPIEAAALIQAFGSIGNTAGKRGFCALGSVKTNIGHLDAAAGIAGLIKTVLALENRTIPASLHFERPNPKISFAESPFYVNARTREWPSDGAPRRAGVSSFGIGGTNAHAVLEEAPEAPGSAPSRRPARLLVLSAKTPTALATATANLADWLEAHPEACLDDVAYTLQVGREPFRHRRFVVCTGREDAVSALRGAPITGSAASGEPSVAFLFPGQGSQHAGMGAGLYEAEPVYRSALDRCRELLRPELGCDLLDLLRSDDSLGRTAVTQPALFAVEYALARLWMSWGIRPAALLGHSVGEYVAACLSGVLSLEDALSLVAARGRLIQGLPAGAMLGVALSEDELRPRLGGLDDLSLAAVNAPRACVVSGPAEAVEAFRAALEAEGVETRPLHTSHAFHSAMMDPALDAFRERVRRVDLRPPAIPYLSNVTGTWITAEQATDPEHWVRHLRETVRFADGVSGLLALPNPVLLETGPGRSLGTLARQHPDKPTVASSLSHVKDRRPDVEAVLGALGRLWLAGAGIDWAGFHSSEHRRRIPLPTYPFERRRHWVDLSTGLGAHFGKTAKAVQPEESPAEETVPSGAAPRTPDEQAVADVWRDLLGVNGLGVHDDFFELGGSSLMAVQLGSRLRQALDVDLPVDFLFQAPTVAAQAELVARLRPQEGETVERPRSSCLVPLQKGDGLPPLFMVHQVGGNVYTFRVLAQALGRDRPVYGLRSRGLEAGEEPFATVEEMAEHYLELVRGVQRSGPYRIGGASMGGMIAFEMAHRLREAGETVELLTLMDTPCGEQMPPRR
ncbi:MAG TPA: amino acid adenylation domain-containing protein, partial [Thermoanaerobaculia bacterium]|nr:amino acid adenylation domain-containing protein [Thermoanaerobaculia bacterium]